jgi:AraC-like DNA-binding protein
MARGLCFEVMQLVSSGTPGPAFDAFASYETVDEMIDLLRLHCQRITEDGAGSGFVTEMTAFIEEHACRADFSIDTAAAHSGMSVSRFSHQFKACFGCNFIDYVTRVKIERAQEMMRQADLPLAEVASAIGYASLSSFIRRFKQITGTTPGEYIRRQKE